MLGLLVRLFVLAALVGLICLEVRHDRRRAAREELGDRTLTKKRKPTGG